MEISIGYEPTVLGFVLTVNPKRPKYWCWSYSDYPTAEKVRTKLTERWTDCPVQFLEDYSVTFVRTVQEVTPTLTNISEIADDWRGSAKDIKGISGKHETAKQD